MFFQSAKICMGIALFTTAVSARFVRPPYNPGAPNAVDITNILNAHNDFRATYGTNPLVWDDALATEAQTYMEAKDNRCTQDHSGTGFENIAAGSPAKYWPLASFVEAWESEASYYDYSKPGFSEGTGHFTQVVWASATKVGCGHATCTDTNSVNNDSSFLLCRYDAGNIDDVNEFIANVPQPIPQPEEEEI